MRRFVVKLPADWQADADDSFSNGVPSIIGTFPVIVNSSKVLLHKYKMTFEGPCLRDIFSHVMGTPIGRLPSP